MALSTRRWIGLAASGFLILGIWMLPPSAYRTSGPVLTSPEEARAAQLRRELRRARDILVRTRWADSITPLTLTSARDGVAVGGDPRVVDGATLDSVRVRVGEELARVGSTGRAVVGVFIQPRHFAAPRDTTPTSWGPVVWWHDTGCRAQRSWPGSNGGPWSSPRNRSTILRDRSGACCRPDPSSAWAAPRIGSGVGAWPVVWRESTAPAGVSCWIPSPKPTRAGRRSSTWWIAPPCQAFVKKPTESPSPTTTITSWRISRPISVPGGSPPSGAPSTRFPRHSRPPSARPWICGPPPGPGPMWARWRRARASPGAHPRERGCFWSHAPLSPGCGRAGAGWRRSPPARLPSISPGAYGGYRPPALLRRARERGSSATPPARGPPRGSRPRPRPSPRP